jgi:hypothetical protein
MSATPATIASDDGERLLDVGRGIELCCETFGDPTDSPLVLVMGLGMQMVHWPLPLIAQLVERGLYVVRFGQPRPRSLDAREIAPPTPSRLPHAPLRRRPVHARGQALTTFRPARRARARVRPSGGRLDGRMIAQTVAASRPRRVRSLTSTMRRPPAVAASASRGRTSIRCCSPAPWGRDAYVEHMLALLAAIGAPGDVLDTPRAARSWASRTTATPTRWNGSPAGGDPRLRQPHAQTARDHGADACGPRRAGSADLRLGRQSDREGDPERSA